MQLSERIIDKLDKAMEAGSALKAEEDIDSESLKDIIDDCFLVIAGRDVFKFSFLGKNIIISRVLRYFSG